MARFAWDAMYETGNSTIDSQHRQLFELANLLHAAVLKGRENKVLVAAAEALLTYTHTHFTDEEGYFKEINSALLRRHKKEHKELVGELELLLDPESPLFDDDVGEKLETWVENRLLPHIIEEDQKAWDAARF